MLFNKWLGMSAFQKAVLDVDARLGRTEGTKMFVTFSVSCRQSIFEGTLCVVVGGITSGKASLLTAFEQRVLEYRGFQIV